LLFALCEALKAFYANQNSLAVRQFSFLQIGIFAAPVRRIVVAPKQTPGTGHNRSFTAIGTMSHI